MTITDLGTQDVSPDRRNQNTVTLSEKAQEEYQLVADWLKMPLATLLRQVLEEHHQSPSFGNLVKRAKRVEVEEE